MNGVKVFAINCSKPTYSFFHEFTGNEHELSFVLSGKTNKHTEVDNNNNIISSAQVEITNITINEFDITRTLLSNDKISSYLHSCNNTTIETVHHGFDSLMGFNGNLVLKFSTPIHTWALTQSQ
jgi:hypothetical protein